VTDPNGYRWEVFVVKVGDTAPDVVAASEACCPNVLSRVNELLELFDYNAWANRTIFDAVADSR